MQEPTDSESALFLILQGNGKSASAALKAHNRYLSVTDVKYLLYKGKAKPVSFLLVGAVTLIKLIKNVSCRFGRDPGTAVLYAENGRSVFIF